MAITGGKHEWVAKGVLKSTWTGLPTGNSTSNLDAPHLPDKTIQVFSAGANFLSSTATVEGSNDGGTTWAALNDSRGEGNSLAFTAADTRSILENPLLIRVTVSGGTVADLVVIIFSQSGRR